MSVYESLLERYESGDLPWDAELPPPEVMEFVPTLPIGRALDLGCGTGRASIYLAKLGWEVDGIDFIPKAIEIAKRRAKAAGVSPRFHLGLVTNLDFLSGPYDFALDVGCCHALAEEDLHAYHHELLRLLRPGGHYLLFAHLRDKDEPPAEDAPHWADEMTLRKLFQNGFILDKAVHGTTQVGDTPPWRSAWFWYRRETTTDHKPG